MTQLYIDCPDCGCVQDGNCLCTPSKPHALAEWPGTTTSQPAPLTPQQKLERLLIERIWREVYDKTDKLAGFDKDWEFWTRLLNSR